MAYKGTLLMKQLIKKLPALFLLALLFMSIPHRVYGFYADDTGPLEPGTVTLGVKAGVAPTFWVLEKSPNRLFAGVEALFNKLGAKTTNNFNDIFDVPIWVAVELGGAITECVQLFGEGVWRYADVKAHLLIDTTKTETFGGYVGIRYYPVNFCTSSIHPYCGFKLGGMCQSINNTITLSKDFISGGFMVGLNASLPGCLNLKLDAEVLFSGPALTAGNFGRTATEITVPLTLGLELAY